jgi:hypothetical protein
MVDDVIMFCRNFDGAVGLRKARCSAEVCRHPGSPGLEAGAVRLVTDARDHEVGQVTELVGEGVDEACVRVDHFFGQLDACVVLHQCMPL